MLTAEDCGRSWRGTSALLSREPDGLKAFDISEAGLWTSFRAVILLAPPFVVTLALARREHGLTGPLFGDGLLALVVAFGLLIRFVALPVAAIPICRRLGLGSRYVPFVVVTNWVDVFGALLLAAPGALLLIGWATPPLAGLYTIGFGTVVLHLRWLAASATLGLGGWMAALLTAGGLVLDVAVQAAAGRLVQLVTG